jgi:hypothetical protein
MNDITRLFKVLLDTLASGSLDQEAVLRMLEDYPDVKHSKLDCDELMARHDLCRSVASGNGWKTVYAGDSEFDGAVPWNDPS